MASMLLFGCSGPVGDRVQEEEHVPAAEGDFGRAVTHVARGSSGFSEVELKERSAGVVIENVAYLSGALTIRGQVCRPDDERPHPVILRNHGGFAGLGGDDADALCRALAAAGYVVASSSYRGEDGSDGNVEACLGEVDDVEAMMDALETQPYVVPDRFAAIGASHGGCITLELAVRRPTLKAAVDFFGFGDMTSLFGFWQRQLQQGEPSPCPLGAEATCGATHAALIELLTSLTGGAPPAPDSAYENRSPVMRLGSIQVPLLILHGTGDYVVDMAQACAKRAALEAAGKEVDAFYLDAQLVPRSPDLCGGRFASTPPAAPLQFVLFEGEGHGFTDPAGAYAWTAALAFVLTRL